MKGKEDLRKTCEEHGPVSIIFPNIFNTNIYYSAVPVTLALSLTQRE